MKYYTDGKRHLVCIPFSRENLHKMAEALKIKRCWYHHSLDKPHYDIPKRRKYEIESQCKIVSPKDIIRIIKGEFDQRSGKEAKEIPNKSV